MYIDASNIITIWDCETLDGAVGSHPELSDKYIKQGRYSVSFRANPEEPRAGYTIPMGSLRGDEVIRIWYISNTFPYLRFENNSLMFYATDGVGTAYWYIDTPYSYLGGWKNVTVDLTITPDVGKMPDWAHVYEIGITHDFDSFHMEEPNIWVDYFRKGIGYIVYDSHSFDFFDIAVEDERYGYGIVVNEGMSYGIYGGVNIGKSDNGMVWFADNGSHVLFKITRVNYNDRYYINLTPPDIMIPSIYSFNNTIFDAEKAVYYKLNFYTPFHNKYTVNMEGVVIRSAKSVKFDQQATVKNTTFFYSGPVYPQGAVMDDIVFTECPHCTGNTKDGNLVIYNASELDTISNIHMHRHNWQSSSPNGIFLSFSVTGSITLNNFSFFTEVFSPTPPRKLYWASPNGHLTVYLRGKHELEEDECYSAGGTITVKIRGTIYITGLVEGSEVRMYNSDLTEEIYGIENVSGTQLSFDYFDEYHPAILVIYHLDYNPIRMELDLDGSDVYITVQQDSDRWYVNPVINIGEDVHVGGDVSIGT